MFNCTVSKALLKSRKMPKTVSLNNDTYSLWHNIIHTIYYNAFKKCLCCVKIFMWMNVWLFIIYLFAQKSGTPPQCGSYKLELLLYSEQEQYNVVYEIQIVYDTICCVSLRFSKNESIRLWINFFEYLRNTGSKDIGL